MERNSPGRAVQTGIHHVPVLMLRRAEDCLDILVPRSFAQSVEKWVEGACLEFLELDRRHAESPAIRA